MRHQIAGFRQNLQSVAEFIFLDAPNILLEQSQDRLITRKFGHLVPFRQWYTVRNIKHSKDTNWDREYDLIDKTIEHIKEKAHSLGRIDAVLAFSQGTVVATLLTAMYIRQQKAPPWKICVCVCGIPVQDRRYRHLFEENGKTFELPLPSMHIFSPQDPLYRKAKALSHMYVSETASDLPYRSTYKFDGGHIFPSVTKYQTMYRDISDQIRKVCGL
uniref:Uncharacterized protein AlNc14C319G10568 n=1 Tax=Albugo laibachii Nc14 TaxID=890382 RepID=F0WWD5_9STRA|nr:conserved hypothetical protein [Albugo laibachii Nc14]|eukprot:CCA25755.1 conserved hypothetical protein [Albugo laibachii Nc14]